MIAILKHNYLKKRQKKGYKSLFQQFEIDYSQDYSKVGPRFNKLLKYS